MITVLVGSYKLIKNNKEFSILIIIPIIIVTIASMLSKYPFETRLILTFIPLLIILSVKSIDNLLKENFKISLISVILFFFTFSQYIYLAPFVLFNKQIYYREEITPLMQILKSKIKDTDNIIIMHYTNNAFDLYNKKFNIPTDKIYYLSSNENYLDIYTKPLDTNTQKDNYYWIMFSQYHGRNSRLKLLRYWIENNSELIDLYENKGAYLFYIRKK